MSHEQEDIYLVVACFNPQHRRVNDQPANDPKCRWCKGLGLVRVRRDHVPVVRHTHHGWDEAPTIVDQIGDLADPNELVEEVQ